MQREKTKACRCEQIRNQTINDCDTLNLTCRFDGFPQTLLIWTKLGSNTSMTNDTGAATLSMSNVTGKDSGQYVCTTQNQDRNLTVDEAVPDVKTPTISGKSTIKQGEGLNLTCTVDNFPLSVITWSKRGINKTLNNETKCGTSTLVIHNVTEQHSGQYVCHANYLNKTLEQDINITVINAWEMKITGEPTVREGGTLNLTCIVDSFPQSVITWSKRGINRTLNNETKYGTSTLVIHNVTEQHSGQYFCHANHLNKTLEQDINITVINAWEMKITGEPTVREGGTLNLTCTVDSFPLSVITWSKRGINKTLNNETKYGTSTLVIHNVTEQHSGQYVCHANHLNKTLEQDINITVINAWEMKITGEPTVREGGTLNLTCTVDSFPQSFITWSKRGINRTLNNETKCGTSTLVIHNVTEQHSGQYFCHANHLNKTLEQDINITVINAWEMKITGEPTVREGGTLNLTCTVDSFPQSFITWSKRGINRTLNNETKCGTSTLVIHNVTEQHSGQYVCHANHLNKTLEQDINITVINAWEMKITGEPTVREGGTLNLTCTVDSFHPIPITWVKLSMNKTLTNETGIKVGTSSLIIQNVTTSNSGQYFCTTKFQSQVQDINVTVTYWRMPEITGNIVVTEGHVLNLTCSVDSWPLSLITWTKSSSSTVLKNDTGSATLLFFNVVAENSGLYICTSEHLNINFTKEVHIKVKKQLQILDKSGCKSQQDVLTCVCISQGFPSPTITWELSNHVDYSFNTVVSNHTVTSTVSINIKGVSNISAVCFSSNTNGQTSRNLSVNEVEDEGKITNVLQTFTQMGIIIPFLVGVLVSAFIFSWLWLCCRKKHKSHGRTSETLEMTNGGHTVDYEPILARGTAGGSNDPEAGTSDIEYSDIHLLIANPLEKKPKKEDTEYAKINPKKESKMEEGEGREEEEEMKLCVPEAEESETVAVYSNVTKLKDQMKETLTLAD